MTAWRLPWLVMALVITGGAAAGAQNFMRRGRVPLREPTPESFDGGFTYCRGMYRQVRSMRSGARTPTSIFPSACPS